MIPDAVVGAIAFFAVVFMAASFILGTIWQVKYGRNKK